MATPSAGFDPEPGALGRCYALARQRAAERRREMAEFDTASAFGWLADLLSQARAKALASTDPELARKHRQIFWHLHGELRRKAAG
jgi:hypothetical protein